MRLPPRGVCRLFFGGFFGQQPENLEFCVVFVKKTMFRSFFHSSLVLFVGDVVVKVSQIPGSSSFVVVDLGGSVAKFLSRNPRKHESFCIGGVSKVT